MCAWALIEKGQALWKNHVSCTAVRPNACWPVYVAAWPSISISTRRVLRVLFLILAVFGGSGLVLYLVMWIVVPDASKA
jgi:PspC domain